MVAVIVGEMGKGKTTYIKEWLSRTAQIGKDHLIYCLLSEDYNRKTQNVIVDRDAFLNKAVRKRNTLFVVDEAITFIPEEKPDTRNKKDLFGLKLYTWLSNSRKLNNPILIVFHSMRDVPVWLIMYTQFFVRFQTMDQADVQARRFRSYPKLRENILTYPEIPQFEYEEIKLR